MQTLKTTVAAPRGVGKSEATTPALAARKGKPTKDAGQTCTGRGEATVAVRLPAEVAARFADELKPYGLTIEQAFNAYALQAVGGDVCPSVWKSVAAYYAREAVAA